MPGRKFSSGDYRFGFNGKENDREWGDQLIQDYGFRLYNPAIGKFLSVDPLSPSYPELTPYQFASNRPIDGIDLDGLEWKEIKGAFYLAGQKGAELVINTAGGVIFAVAHPIQAATAIKDGVISTAKDVGTIYGAFGNIALGNGASVDRKEFYDAAQRQGKGLLEEAGGALIFGGIAGAANKIQKANKGTLNSGFNPLGNRDVPNLGAGELYPNYYDRFRSFPNAPSRFGWNNHFVNVTIYGAQQQLKGLSGVYVHKFDDGSIYVGQASDFSKRLLDSHNELYNDKGYANGKKYLGTEIYLLEGSGYKSLDHMEGDYLNNKYNFKKEGGEKVLNHDQAPNWEKNKGDL